jgi:asparagine synthase (glutamine-hydrolysing)
MYLLSKLVRENNIKVVLTGEGADEFLGGYNIYREDKIRRFWARQPESVIRPLLLRKLYPYIADLSDSGDAYLAAFFRRGLSNTGAIGYSHQIRWHNTSRLHRLFSADVQSNLGDYSPVDEFLHQLDGAISNWGTLAQAQYIEVTTFMSPYLLSSQGDRMMAANSVEGRFPFLDHRVIEFCASLPPQLKIRGLREKYLLKKSAEGLLPHEICRRHKQPYRAPIHPAFFDQSQEYVEELLSPRAIRASGYFRPEAVSRLVAKCKSGRRVSEGDDMALIGSLSVQLLHQMLIQDLDAQRVPEASPVRICHGKERIP